MAASWPPYGARVARAATGHWLVVLFVSLVAGCATAPETTPDRVYAGRFSALATQGDKRERVSGRFSVEVRGDRQRIELFVGQLLLEFGMAHARRTRKKGDQYEGEPASPPRKAQRSHGPEG